MSFADYDALKASISDWIANDQITSVIPDFVRLAEVRLQRDLKMRFTEVTTTGMLVPDQDYIDLPAGCIEPRHLSILTHPQAGVHIVAPSEFDRVRVSRDLSGRPVVALSRGLTLALAPTPNAADDYTLIALHGITPLSMSNPTNWLLQTAPDALLHGSLVQGGLYMGNDERLPGWEMAYQDAKDSLRRQEFRARTGGGPLQIRSDSSTP